MVQEHDAAGGRGVDAVVTVGTISSGALTHTGT
jgi:hypothetical protein